MSVELLITSLLHIMKCLSLYITSWSSFFIYLEAYRPSECLVLEIRAHLLSL